MTKQLNHYDSASESKEASEAAAQRAWHASHVCSRATCGFDEVTEQDEQKSLDEAAAIEKGTE